MRTTYGTDKADQDRRDKTSPGRRRRRVDIPNCKQQYVDAPKQQSALIGFWVRLAEAHQDSMIRNKGFVTQPVNFFFDVYESRFEFGDHRINDRRMREHLVDFLLEDLLS